MSDTRKSSTVADTASRGVTSVVPFASQRQPWRVVRGRKVPIVIAASVLAAFGFGVGLGSTFVSGPSRAGAGAVLHHSKQKHPSRPDPTTTSTPSTSTTSTTTTVPQLTAGQAASRVDSAIERGVANGTIPAPLAQQLTNAVQPIIAPALSGDPQQTIQLFDELVQQFDQSVTNGQVSDPATVDQVDAALSRLAATLGVALPTGVEPGGPTPGGGDGGNGNGFGNGNGYGDTGGGNG